jgi:GT2 family glycosyltransferase
MTAGRAPSVAIIVLNYNGLHLTEPCLESLQQLDYPEWRAIVIDNGSARDESIALKARFGEPFDIIRNDEALGFCAGNNQGMRIALDRGFDYILWLNNDTTVEKDFATELVAFMESDPDLGLANPKMIRYDDRTRIDGMGGDLNLWIARHVLYRRPYDEVRTNLTFAHGGAFFLRRAAIEQVGFLDESYYAYWEEADYCLRLRKRGWRIGCTPRSIVYHKGGQTNRYLSNLYIYYMVRNGFLCVKRNGRWFQWPSFTVCFLASSVVNYIGYLLLTRPRDLGIPFEAIGDFLRGRLGRKEFRTP